MAFHGHAAVITAFTLTSVSTVIVGLRLYCRYFLSAGTSLSDYLMIAAVLVTWGTAVVNYYQTLFADMVVTRNSMDMNALKVGMAGILLTWYLYRLFYLVNIFLVKLSILFFYRNLVKHTSYRHAISATMTIVSVLTLALFIITIFLCTRPSDAWSLEAFLIRVSGRPAGRCYNPAIVWLTQAGFNLSTDLIILLLPIPFILSLKVPLSRRLALVGVFSIGIIAIIASAIRVWIMAKWSSRQAQYGEDMILWGQVEINSGIISSSIPFLRPLFKQAFESSSAPRVWVVRKSLSDGGFKSTIELVHLNNKTGYSSDTYVDDGSKG